MQFLWLPYPARLPPPVRQFYRFPLPLPEFEEDLEAGIPDKSAMLRRTRPRTVSGAGIFCQLRLDSHKQHHLHRETGAPRFRLPPST